MQRHKLQSRNTLNVFKVRLQGRLKKNIYLAQNISKGRQLRKVFAKTNNIALPSEGSSTSTLPERKDYLKGRVFVLAISQEQRSGQNEILHATRILPKGSAVLLNEECLRATSRRHRPFVI